MSERAARRGPLASAADDDADSGAIAALGIELFERAMTGDDVVSLDGAVDLLTRAKHRRERREHRDFTHTAVSDANVPKSDPRPNENGPRRIWGAVLLTSGVYW